MDNILRMSTTGRHNKITSSLFGNIFDFVRNNEIYALQEQCSLVYRGQKNDPKSLSLVKTEDIEDMEEFKEFVIYELDYVQPDFFLFKDNEFLTDSRDVRTAGQPDLIVEVWSKSNTKSDREFLQALYSKSDITEFWQIDQNSNKVKCSIGSAKLPEQSLLNILKTQKGLEFDLRYLAV
ncbi:MAG: Uma2 family endonuclease [Oscillospiraceae bacterium]|nr:Uma2 family endonuclease [Oscillospiraceae bacterium]